MLLSKKWQPKLLLLSVCVTVIAVSNGASGTSSSTIEARANSLLMLQSEWKQRHDRHVFEPEGYRLPRTGSLTRAIAQPNRRLLLIASPTAPQAGHGITVKPGIPAPSGKARSAHRFVR